MTESLAKITPPAFPEIYLRERLFKLIDQRLANACLWLSAPGGAGKTTLVGSYLARQRNTALWYNLDAMDGDLPTFFYYLSQAAGKAAPRKKLALPLLTPEYLLDVPVFARRFFEKLYARLTPPALIVLDNYQEIPADSALHEIILLALAGLPPNIKLIIISRAQPPAAFARLLANRQLEKIGWEELRLDFAETEGIAGLSKQPRLSAEKLRRLHDKVQGWLAGMILLLENSEPDELEPFLDGGQTPEEIFAYFAGEAFAQVDDKVQDFLLKTAFLPEITPALAEAVTGHKQPGRILSSLHQNNFFTERRLVEARTIYKYHPLFKEYLQAQAEDHYPADKLAEIRRQAATLLEAAGQAEEAAELFIKAGETKALVGLIINQAPAFIGQGRQQTVEKWIRALPEKVLEESPWLLFWLGNCRLPYDHLEAQSIYETAYQAFKQAKDFNGLGLAWAGIVDTFLFVWEDFARLKSWLTRLATDWSGRDLDLPPEIFARVTFARYAALVLVEPANPELPELEQQVTEIMHACPEVNQKIFIGNFIASELLRRGELASANALIRLIEGFAQQPEASNLSKIIANNLQAYGCLREFSPEKGKQSLNDSIKLAEETGIRMLDTSNYTYAAYLSLCQADLETADFYLQRVGRLLNRDLPLQRAHYYYMLGGYEALRGDYQAAGRHLRQAATITEESAFPYAQFLSLVDLARLLLEEEEKDYPQIEALLEKAWPLAENTRNNHLLMKFYLVQAKLAFSRRRQEDGEGQLQQAFALGRQWNLMFLEGWLPGEMAEYCKIALQAGIEMEYVRKLINRHSLTPRKPPLEIEDWPWPLKIYTLGRFALVKNGEAMAFSGKTQKKPLQMLKTLIALGGQEVAVEHLADALWPESDGDAAHDAFKTTLKRLRRLLGDDRIISHSGGRVSLDKRCCWIDTWALEQRLSAGNGRIQGENQRQLLNTLNLYQGAFLAQDGELACAAPLRARLQQSWSQAVKQLADQWLAEEKIQAVIALYEQLIAVHHLEEDFYLRLMLCYQASGQTNMAKTVYRRCRETLNTHGLSPSAATEAAYQKILAD